MKSIVATCVVLLVVAAGVAAQKPKYGVTVTAEKNVDFAKFKSYSWTRGQPSLNKKIDAQIVTAVDRELNALGLTKAKTGPGDVLAAYYALTRTDIDPRAKSDDAKGNQPEYQVGTLSVALLDPGSRKELLRLRMDKPIEGAKIDEAIDSAVTELFASYPTRKRP
jgi:hypothetical protein